jgi:hypothetical protein
MSRPTRGQASGLQPLARIDLLHAQQASEDASNVAGVAHHIYQHSNPISFLREAQERRA